MNEVDTFAKAGETAGAAVGTGVQTVREGATRARRQLADQVAEHGTVGRAAREAGASAQTALADSWGALQENFPERWDSAQELLADRMTGARRALAARPRAGAPAAPAPALALDAAVARVVGQCRRGGGARSAPAADRQARCGAATAIG